jgi:tetratricopeptide (TPR) repeat protein
MNMIKRLMTVILLAFMCIAIYGQVPPEEFFKGLDLLGTDFIQAKKEFKTAYQKDSLFHGTSHFLGVIYLRENKSDSAIYFFKKSIRLNSENVNHTKEMTYVRLIDTYLNKMDFKNSFSTAWEAYLMYPDNNVIAQGLKDVCLWSFYIRYNGLDSTYLSPATKKEYIVNSIDEEYLVVRRIRINDNPLSFNGQRLVKIRRENYDILSCIYSKNAELIDVKFKLNWDMKKYYGGKVADTKSVYTDLKNPVYERIGALLVSDSKINLKDEITKIKNE